MIVARACDPQVLAASCFAHCAGGGQAILLDDLFKRPHQKTETLSVEFAGETFHFGDFRNSPTRCKYIAMMPQWDFLNMLADEARTLPNLRLMMSTRADDLIVSDGQVTGISATGEGGSFDIQAGLTIAADGRSSTLRAQ